MTVGLSSNASATGSGHRRIRDPHRYVICALGICDNCRPRGFTSFTLPYMKFATRNGSGIRNGRNRSPDNSMFRPWKSILESSRILGVRPNPPWGTSNSNYCKGSLNSTSRFPYRIGADRTDEIVDAARARTPRLM
jgi:hypothetical protein